MTLTAPRTRVETLVVGGGQAGLALSRCLRVHGVEHVVLERGRVAERWRSERWDSLRLLTPRWQSRLPGFGYAGPDPDGYMDRAEVVAFLEAYAAAIGAPVETGVTVTRIARDPRGGFAVDTDRGAFRADTVVVATGHCDTPRIPHLAAALPPDVAQLDTTRYRNPGQLAPGGVLVVGASASGLQLAAEIHASGRPVTLAVGRHTRLPRTWRGRDILYWFDALGLLAQRAGEVRDLAAARREPSLQLVGTPTRATLDLGVLQRAGVRVVGRVVAVDGTTLRLADDLPDLLAAAEARLARQLDRIDAFIARERLPVPRGARPAPVPLPPPSTTLDLRAAGIGTVLWATGFRRSYPWLQVPVLDAVGEIIHDGGITAVPGLYVLGLQFLRRRNSSFLDGVGADARELAATIAGRLASSAA
jgi:putative flavoprotein involved in K+ transport